ncbi:MAG: Stp1/IreP family PP2C-type Ser/Thr phosphatase [Bdellovibrionales bacterium]|nr:Stp1/IreP family PP2C-type Ser/Thr phosphatase [Bdellovibrionales bacterium]
MLGENSGKHSSEDISNREALRVPAAITDTGCERDLNEDRYAAIESPSGLAWLVCDGMGGVTGGELAAQLAIDGVRRDLEGQPGRPPAEAFESAVLEANRIIVLRRQNQAFAHMGTTLVGALFSDVEVVIAHVGDSRAYVVRDHEIRQVTKDHTYVQELVDKGAISAHEALSHPQAHILTRAIGSEPGLQVDITKYWLWDVGAGEDRDVLLLCSDGLYSHVADQEIKDLVEHNSPQQACVKLVELAKARGGFDNITVAIIPLDGTLHDEPPIGYSEKDMLASLAKRQSMTMVKEVNVKRLWRTVFVIGVLSVLVVMLVLTGMAFLLGR